MTSHQRVISYVVVFTCISSGLMPFISGMVAVSPGAV